MTSMSGRAGLRSMVSDAMRGKSRFWGLISTQEFFKGASMAFRSYLGPFTSLHFTSLHCT